MAKRVNKNYTRYKNYVNRDEGDYEYRPNLYDPDTEDFDYTEFKARRKRMDRLQEQYTGFIFVAIFSNFVDGMQFCFTNPTTGGFLSVWYFQIPFLLDRDALIYAGRDIGKSFTMRMKLILNGIKYPRGSHMFVSFDQAHVKPLMTKLFAAIDENPLLALFAKPKSVPGARSSSFPMKQTFWNGYELWGIAVGTQSSKAAESPHVNGYSMDEGQHFPLISWKKMSPAINDQTAYREYGAMRMIVGVNSEGDLTSVFHDKAYSEDSEFIGHIYHYPSWYNPINYTMDKHKDYLKLYGGSIYASEFKQMIRGLEGEAQKGVFNEEDLLATVENGYKVGLVPRYFRLTPKIWANGHEDLEDMLSARFVNAPNARCIISADIGKTAATEIGVWFLLSDADGSSYWSLWGRICLVGFKPNITAKIIDGIDSMFEPELLSLDATGLSNPVSQILTDPENPNYNKKRYNERLFEASFTGNMIMYYTNEKPVNAGSEYKPVKGEKNLWAVQGPSNVFSTELIQKWLEDGTMALPNDPELIHDMTSMIAVNTGKQTVYKGNSKQHIVSMMRAFTQMYHVLFTLSDQKVTVLNRDRYTGPSATVYAATIQFGGFNY